MAIYSAGSASVQIVPDFSNAQKRIGQWFASQKDMTVGVRPDLNQADMARVHAQVAAHKPKLNINIDKAHFAKELVSTVNFLTGTSMVGDALRKLFDVKPILIANLGGAGVALAAPIAQAVTGLAALGPAMLASLAPIGAAIALSTDGMHDLAKATNVLNPAIARLRKAVNGPMWEGINKAVISLGRDMLPMLQKQLPGIAHELNGMGKALIGALDTKANIADFATLIDNTKAALHEATAAVKPLWSVFQDLATVGSQFLPGMAKGFANLAQRFADFIKHARDTGELAAFMQKAIDTTKTLFSIVRNLGSAIGGIFKAAAPAGMALMAILKVVTADLASFMKSAEGQAGLGRFFDQIVTAVDQLTPGLNALVKALVVGVLPAMSGFASAVAPVVNGVLVQFADLLSELAPLFYPALAGAISTALTALSPLMGVFSEIAKSVLPPLIEAVNRLAPLFSELAEGVGDALVRAIQALAPALPPIVDALVAIAEALVPTALQIADLAVALIPPLVVVLKALAEVLEFIAPILPVIATAWLGWKVLGSIQGLVTGFAGSLKTLAQNAAFASYSMGGIGGTTAGRVSGGLSRMASAAMGLSRALPIVGVAVGIVAAAMEHGETTAKEYAQAILAGGNAADDAWNEASKGDIIEALTKNIGGLGTIVGLWTTNSEEAAEAQRELWRAMSPLEQAQSKVTYWQNELNQRMRDFGKGSPEVEAAQRRLHYWSGEVAYQQERQGNATKTATDRLKEQRDLILETANVQLAYERAQLNATDAVAEYTRVMGDANATESERAQVSLQVRDSIIAAAEAAARKAEMDNKGKTSVEITNAANAAYLQTMKDLASQLTGPARLALDGLIQQLENTGGNADVVRAKMADLGLEVDSIPTEKSVIIKAPTDEQKKKLQELGYTVVTLPNGDIIVYTDTRPAQDEINAFLAKRRTMQIDVALRNGTPLVIGGGVRQEIGGVVKAFAAGGFMPGNIASIVPPNTWRIVGDRVRDDEAFIPINNSARSEQILKVTAEQMGFGLVPNADGNYWMPPGMTSVFSSADAALTATERDAVARSRRGTDGSAAPTSVAGFVNNGTVVTTDLDELARKSRLGTQRALAVAHL